MQANYGKFIDRMISKYEGGYGWNKKDAGGPTKYGITCFDLAEHRGQKMSNMATWAPVVKAMTLAEAEDIYAKKYAVAVRFNDLPAGVDCCMLDYGVNSGTARPIRVARAILKLPAGTSMDFALLDAIKKTDPVKFVNDMCAERLIFMRNIRGGKDWKEFGTGWLARVTDLRLYALNLIVKPSTGPAPAPDLSNVPTPKAINTPESQATATTGTVISTTAAAHFGGMSHWVVVAVFVVGIAAAIAYEIYAAKKSAKANATVVLPTGAL